MNRNLSFGGLALILVPATAAVVLRVMPEGEPTTLRAFAAPSHRVAMATGEEMESRLLWVERGESQTTLDGNLVKITVASAKPGDIPIPVNSPAFWTVVPGVSATPVLANLHKMEFEGKTRDGRPVRVTVAISGRSEGTLVSIKGDPAVAGGLLDAIAGRLARPKLKPGSPEETSALMAFFNQPPEPSGDDDATSPDDPAVIKAATSARP